jgi:alpha-galactosidase
MLLRCAAALALLARASAINNGLARTPPMGWNSWMAIGWSISDAYTREIADFLNASGLQAAGYTYVNR